VAAGPAPAVAPRAPVAARPASAARPVRVAARPALVVARRASVVVTPARSTPVRRAAAERVSVAVGAGPDGDDPVPGTRDPRHAEACQPATAGVVRTGVVAVRRAAAAGAGAVLRSRAVASVSAACPAVRPAAEGRPAAARPVSPAGTAVLPAGGTRAPAAASALGAGREARCRVPARPARSRAEVPRVRRRAGPAPAAQGGLGAPAHRRAGTGSRAGVESRAGADGRARDVLARKGRAGVVVQDGRASAAPARAARPARRPAVPADASPADRSGPEHWGGPQPVRPPRVRARRVTSPGWARPMPAAERAGPQRRRRGDGSSHLAGSRGSHLAREVAARSRGRPVQSPG
jgi:hypothetical protein